MGKYELKKGWQGEKSAEVEESGGETRLQDGAQRARAQEDC